MISREQASLIVDKVLKAANIGDNDILELWQIAEKLPYTKQSLIKYCAKGDLKSIHKGPSKNSGRIVLGENLRAFLLNNYIINEAEK